MNASCAGTKKSCLSSSDLASRLFRSKYSIPTLARGDGLDAGAAGDEGAMERDQAEDRDERGRGGGELSQQGDISEGWIAKWER